jgi:hypothetical protein
MPEPLIGESVTDIDSLDSGEVELDLTETTLRSTQAETGGMGTSLETEWRVTKNLGLSAEIATTSDETAEFSGTASWSLLHDLKHGFHLQAEIGIRSGETNDREWEDASLPLSFGLRAGLYEGDWTLRGSLGGEALGTSAHSLPIRAGFAVFHGIGAEGKLGFTGVELVGDWGNSAPFFLAPTLVAHVPGLTLPMYLGLALPYSPASDTAPTSWGAVIRATYEFDVD